MKTETITVTLRKSELMCIYEALYARAIELNKNCLPGTGDERMDLARIFEEGQTATISINYKP